MPKRTDTIEGPQCAHRHARGEATRRLAAGRARTVHTLDSESPVGMSECASPLRAVSPVAAAETENVEQYARGKLEKKGLDMIAANQVGHDQGFDRDDDTLSVLWQSGKKDFATATKVEPWRR